MTGTLRALLGGEAVCLYRAGEAAVETSPGIWFALTPEDATVYQYFRCRREARPVRVYRVSPDRVIDARGDRLRAYLEELAARHRPRCCSSRQPCDRLCRDDHRLADRVLAVHSLAEDAEAILDAEVAGTAIIHDDLYGDREHVSVLVVLPEERHVQPVSS